MQLKIKGIAHLIGEPIVGTVTRNEYSGLSSQILIADSRVPASASGFRAMLTSLPNDSLVDIPSVYSVSTFDYLQEGDIVAVHSDGTINTLYRVSSNHNSLLFTERCNSNCLMCSQPPKNREDTVFLYNIYRQLIPQIPKDCRELGITGGEPTLMGRRYFDLLQQLQHELPETDVHCLTNGRTFAYKHIAELLGELDYSQLMLGIPLYSDYHLQHDYIVQAKNAFNQTMQGLYNLAAVGQRIEIRVVLHQQTIPRLTRLAKYIYRNLPFVEHIAFMGLEFQGYTPHNMDKLWVNPVDYMEELREAVYFLSDMGLHVSIYNMQLCLMPEDLWQFSKKSISDWKNGYLPACQACSKFNACGGLFVWNFERYNELVTPFA